MVHPTRPYPPDLANALAKQGHTFRFHAAMKGFTASLPNPLTWHHAIHIGTNPSFGAGPTDIETITFKTNGQLLRPQVPRLTLNFFGIDARQGPLPDPYIEQIQREILEKNPSLHEFLNIFNHRLASLLHEVRQKYWVGIDIRPPEKTPYGKSFSALLGLNGTALAGRLDVPDRSLLYYAGLLWQRPRPKEALPKILEHFFKVPVALKECLGAYHAIPPTQQTTLGKRGAFSTLSTSAIVGRRFWDQQSGFLILLGPLDLSTYIDFLKPGPKYKALIALLKFMDDKSHAIQIGLKLKGTDLPRAQLGRGAALGWTSFLKKKSALKTGAKEANAPATDAPAKEAHAPAKDRIVYLTDNPSFLPACMQKRA